jgi:MSHA biogenesis protein MshK
VCKSRVGILWIALVWLFASATVAAQNLGDGKAEKILRDPTAPLGHAAAASGKAATHSDYTLDSVLISAQRKHAVINGITLREGQIIPGSAGIVVKRISAQTVVLQQDAKTWALRLAPSVVIRH